MFKDDQTWQAFILVFIAFVIFAGEKVLKFFMLDAYEDSYHQPGDLIFCTTKVYRISSNVFKSLLFWLKWL